MAFDPVKDIKDLNATVSTGWGFLSVMGTIIVLAAIVGLVVKVINATSNGGRKMMSFI